MEVARFGLGTKNLMAGFQAKWLVFENNSAPDLKVVNFEQTHPRGRHKFGATPLAGKIVPIPKSDKHKEYARYAAHCLTMVTSAKDQGSRAIQREMAAEWLRLADAVRRPSKRGQMQMQ
jgi:hypothetical protein